MNKFNQLITTIMKKTIVMLIMLVVAFGTSFAQVGNNSKKAEGSDLTAKVPIDKKVRVGKLDNGMTYYIRANKKPENRVEFRLVTNAGAVLEDDDQQGLAHFCEHMAFNGTKYYKGNQMISELQKNGIEFGRGINAWTAFDETVYYVDLPADRPEMIEMGFKIVDGWAEGLLFDPEEIEHERGVIIEEWRGGLGANERLMKATFPIMLNNSKYASRLPIGKEEIIRNFKRETIVRFYNDWYRTDLQAVVIVGDINVDQMEAKIKEYFSARKAQENPRKRPEFDIPKNVEPLVAIAQDKEATSTTLEMFWKHDKAPQGTIGDYRASIVRNLVNMMISDRFTELSEKASAPMIAADGGYGGFLGRSCDAYTLYAMPKEGKIMDCVELLLTEMRRIDQHGFLQVELDRQKEELLSRYTKMAKEENKTENTSLAQEYTNHFLEGDVIPGIRQEWKYAKEFIPTITLEEVNQVVSTWITDENFVFYLTAPDKVAVPTKAEVLSTISKLKSVETTPWVDNFKDEPLFAKQLPAVTPRMTKENTALGYKEYTLDNGIKFIVKKTDYKADEIRMNSFSWGGTSLYEDAEAYTAGLVSGLIDDAGIANFSSSQLQKKLKGLNVGISPSLGQLTQGFSGSCSPKDFETMMQLLNLYYEAPRKDQESFDRNIEAMKNQYKFIGENPQYVFLNEFYKTIYNNNPRLTLIPTEDQINGVKLDRVYEMFKERFNDASGMTFFFVGNISDEEVALAAKYLANLPCTGKQKNEKFMDRDPKMVPGITRKEVFKGSDNQGILMIYGETEGFNPTPENRMIISQLSDAMEISALEIIREKMGGTYSPSVSVSSEILPTGKVTWMFYINCDPDNASKVEAAAIDILKSYIKKGPNKATLAKVQEQMIGNRETAMQDNGFWMGQITGSYMYNENRDANASLSEYSKKVKSVSAKDIKNMAKQFIDLNHYAVVTLKPESK